MSASSIARAAADVQLQQRIIAMTNKEVIFNATLAATEFGLRVQQGIASFAVLFWPVAVETEAAYENALLSGRGAPGFDTDIITDGALTSAITAHWPADTNVVPGPGGVVPVP